MAVGYFPTLQDARAALDDRSRTAAGRASETRSVGSGGGAAVTTGRGRGRHSHTVADSCDAAERVTRRDAERRRELGRDGVLSVRQGWRAGRSALGAECSH